MEKWPAVILAGGLGTRLGEITENIPKPMVRIGGRPILWHIMKHYGTFGITRFIILGGYKCEIIKRYFCDYALNTSDIEVHIGTGAVKFIDPSCEDWSVTILDCGDTAGTAERIRAARRQLQGASGFFLTYGDGVSDVQIPQVADVLTQHHALITLTAVAPPGRYGQLHIEGNQVTSFSEKPPESGRINGGFFAARRELLDEIDDDAISFEADVLPQIAARGQLVAYEHDGFWQSMDTPRDVTYLQELWAAGSAPWRTWS